MPTPTLILPFLLLVLPFLYLFSALSTFLFPPRAAQRQFVFALVALAAVLAAGAVALWSPEPVVNAWVAASPLRLLTLGLIAFIALIIARYSQQYLSGEDREAHYYRSLHCTLAAVSLAVISNHMLLLLVAWVAISLGLHQLLLFYPERPRAKLAAHKKFLFARLAEVSLLGAALLLHSVHGTWQIDVILAAYPRESLSGSEQWAAVLLALTALVKCAQLPVHGWLIQVVEAPTPVSALLHAGIINLGGFLLILFAPLMLQATAAQWLVLTVAGMSTLLAGLIMMTRISVKVRLAWSTVAQMGFMLVECALGLFDLALLHLMAHSCYKAHAFLNAGSAVSATIVRQLSPAAMPSRTQFLGAAVLSCTLVALPLLSLAPEGPYSPWLLMTLCLTILLAERSGSGQSVSLWFSGGIAVGLVLVHTLEKAGFSGLGASTPGAEASAGLAGDLWVCALALVLMLGYALLRYAPDTRIGKVAWCALYSGLNLDEWSTRITLSLWPARLPVRQRDPCLSLPQNLQEMPHERT